MQQINHSGIKNESVPKYINGEKLWTLTQIPLITVCPRCNGRGRVADSRQWNKCNVCNGTGKAKNNDVRETVSCEVTVISHVIRKISQKTEIFYKVDGNGIFGCEYTRNGELVDKTEYRKEKNLFKTKEEAEAHKHD